MKSNNRFSLVAVAMAMVADDLILSQSRAAAASVGVAAVLIYVTDLKKRTLITDFWQFFQKSVAKLVDFF